MKHFNIFLLMGGSFTLYFLFCLSDCYQSDFSTKKIYKNEGESKKNYEIK